MRVFALLFLALGVCATALPIVHEEATVAKRVDADDAVVYPDESFYAEDFKRSVDADESVVYPDEKFYAEDFKKRSASDADEAVVYPDESFYAEDF